jgi:transposase, IS4 family
MDAAYDSSDIYEYIFENSKCSPVIDTNRRRGIIDSKLSHSRREGMKIRREEASRYSLRWEIERTFAILQDILGCEFLWYARHRNYDVTIGMKIVAYNIIILINQIYQRPKRQIMDVVVFLRNLGRPVPRRFIESAKMPEFMDRRFYKETIVSSNIQKPNPYYSEDLYVLG